MVDPSSCQICSGPHDIQYCMENPEQAFVDYASSRDNEVGGRQFATNLGLRNFKEATNAWKNKPRFYWEQTQSFISPQKGSFFTYSSCDQVKLERTLRDSMAHVNAASTNQIEKEELQNKGIKSPSKLLSPKYYVVILHKEDGVREEENVNPNITKYNNHEITAKAEEKVEEESEDEFEEEIEEENKEEYKDVEYFDTFHNLEELRYHIWLLKYPKPSWVNAKIRTENTTSIIDHDLGAVVFGKPFVEKTRLIFDKKEGTVTVSTDRIPPFIIGGNEDDNEKPTTRTA
ncbi:hypothetical protein Tco_0910600 [Tanacetum coccineum]|uniref:MAK10-like protein n=1 Tax=Tanacetum coccineum TaxID=301880 RepID=A0ABQ5CUI6_9ASTR